MPATRLLTQRPAAAGKHQRSGQRSDRRANPSDHTPWGTKGWPVGVGTGVVAYGANMGTPGDWSPEDATKPATVAALIASPVNPDPDFYWHFGTYVQTATAGAPGQAHWNGAAWVSGTAAFTPVGKNIDVVQAYINSYPALTSAKDTEIARVRALEVAGANRATLLAWLDAEAALIP